NRGRRHLVRERHLYVETIGVELVWPGNRRSGNVGHDNAPRHEGPGVVKQRTLHAHDSAVVIYRYRHVPVLVALLCGAEEMLTPVLGKFDGRAKMPSGERDN